MFTVKNTRRLELYCYITFFNPSSKKWKEEVPLNLESKEQPDFIPPSVTPQAAVSLCHGF